MAERKCSLCNAAIESEEPAVLTISAYGNPRHICRECEKTLDTATLGTDYNEITDAIGKVARAAFGTDDELVIDTVKEILDTASARAEKIKDGCYDFAEDETEQADGGFDELPEELLETEEDKALDEKEAKQNARLDKITTWMCGVIFVLALVFFLLKFVFDLI